MFRNGRRLAWRHALTCFFVFHLPIELRFLKIEISSERRLILSLSTHRPAKLWFVQRHSFSLSVFGAAKRNACHNKLIKAEKSVFSRTKKTELIFRCLYRGECLCLQSDLLTIVHYVHVWQWKKRNIRLTFWQAQTASRNEWNVLQPASQPSTALARSGVVSVVSVLRILA